jgi:hypothetical protein
MLLQRICAGATIVGTALVLAAPGFAPAFGPNEVIEIPTGHCARLVYADADGNLTVPPADAEIRQIKTRVLEPYSVEELKNGATIVRFTPPQPHNLSEEQLAAGKANSGAVITLSIADPSGFGFNDNSAPKAGQTGNSGTTLGQQRQIAFQAAADDFAARLQSNVTIVVSAQFATLTCGPGGANLGSAGPETGFINFPSAPVANTIYVSALVDAIAGTEQDPGFPDINATFSVNLDSGCFTPRPGGWYYGLDGNTPGNALNFYDTVLHELGHGLGFLTFTNASTGARGEAPPGTPRNDVYMLSLRDETANNTWPNLTNAGRQASAINTGNLTNVNAEVVALAGNITSAGKVGSNVRMYAPNPVQPGSSVSHWDTSVQYSTGEDELMEPFDTGNSLPLSDPRNLTIAFMKGMGWVTVSPVTDWMMYNQ